METAPATEPATTGNRLRRVWRWMRATLAGSLTPPNEGGNTTTLKQQIRSIERTIARFKKESRGKRFASITSVELERKLANDPFIMMLRFDSSTVPGGKIEADLRVANYTISSRMCLHAWVGSGMVDPWGDTILLNVDTRFPRLTDCSGYIGERDIKLTLQIPTSVERTNYFLYFCLLAVGWDRKIFDRYIGEFQVR